MTYDPLELKQFAQSLLLAAGLPDDKAACVAEVLLEGDLLGHTTHGLALLSPYLSDIQSGSMQKNGDPLVISDHPGALLWDGCRLPGPWLVRQAMTVAMARARVNGTCTVVIKRSHHIAWFPQQTNSTDFAVIPRATVTGDRIISETVALFAQAEEADGQCIA